MKEMVEMLWSLVDGVIIWFLRNDEYYYLWVNNLLKETDKDHLDETKSIISFIEEKRSNDKNIPIEIYDEDGYFTPFFETLNLIQIKNFNDESISSLFNVSHNLEEFKLHIDEYLYNTKENTRWKTI